MSNEPKMLKNIKGEKVEFFYGGELYVFEPGQSRLLDGEVAYQVMVNQNTGLVEVPIVGVEDVAPDSTGEEEARVNYESMTYIQLRSIASARGIFKVGMKKAELIELLS